MNVYKIAELESTVAFSKTVVLDSSFLLLPSQTPFTPQLKQSLKNWGFTDIYSEGIPTPIDETKPIAAPKEMNIMPAASGTKNGDDAVRIATCRTVYVDSCTVLYAIFLHYVTHKKIYKTEVTNLAKQLCSFIRENNQYMLQLVPEYNKSAKDYFVNHAMRSTSMAISLGMKFKISPEQLVDLASASLLHEIGMLNLPPQIYLSDRPMKDAEFRQISTHPSLGSDAFTEAGFPPEVVYAVLQHHEKEDGSGYPNGLRSASISPYAKILAVSCAYDAITAPRTYKTKESMHTALLELLKNTGKQFDERIIRMMVYSLSLYPIGSVVLLSDGNTGTVIDIDSDNPRAAVVRLQGEKVVVADGIRLKIVQEVETAKTA